jgi:fermentation-respiration switch protein FrsA (DUF1100 family)
LGLAVAVVAGAKGRSKFHQYILNSICYPVRQLADETPASFGLPFEEVALITRDKLTLSAWYIPRINSKATIIIAHGYSGSKAPDVRHAVWLYNGGYSVFMLDFRGHGYSDGPKGTSGGFMERLDIHAAVDWLLGKGERRIGLYGISYGAATGITAAGENPHISAIVADSPYAEFWRSTATEVARMWNWPLWACRPVAKYAYKVVAKYHGFNPAQSYPQKFASRISPRPIFLIHGGQDKLTQVENSQIIYTLAKEPKTLWIDPDREHTEMYDHSPEEYSRRVLAFFDAVEWEAAVPLADSQRWETQFSSRSVSTLDGR